MSKRISRSRSGRKSTPPVGSTEHQKTAPREAQAPSERSYDHSAESPQRVDPSETVDLVNQRRILRSAVGGLVARLASSGYDPMMVAECLDGAAQGIRSDYEQRKRLERRGR